MSEILINSGNYDDDRLVIDGELIKRLGGNMLRYSVWGFTDAKELNVYDKVLSERISDFSAKELKEAQIIKCLLRLESLKTSLFNGIPKTHEEWSKRNEVKILWRNGSNTIPYSYFYFDFDFQKWAKPYSYETYKKYLANETQKTSHNSNIFFSSTINRSNDSVRFSLDERKSLREQINKFIRILGIANQKALEKLEEEYGEFSLKEFDFPVEVRTYCDQYLMFFVDFLKEVGVNATANINHDKLGRTLFQILPENPKIALETIREALELYLELPMSPLIDNEEMTDIRILSLRAEINTLKSRLDLAQIKQIETEKRASLLKELVDAKEEIIKGKDSQNQALQKYRPSVLAESAVEKDYVEAEIVEETIKKEVSNKEIDMGLVTLKPAKLAGGLEVNTPRLARLGIKKGKELFDYLDKKFNLEEDIK